MKIALFDLDHTLLALDSDHAWGEFTVRLGWADPDEFRRRNDAFYEQYQAGTLDIHVYVEFATRVIRQRGRDDSLRAREQFMQEVIVPAIQPAARALVERHRAAGDFMAIVTATNAFVTEPIARAFGVDHLIAVDLATDESGWYNGAIKGTPSFREGKVLRVQEWLHQHHWLREQADIRFYSDSANDLPLLRWCDHPVATNPSPGLRAEAIAQGWPILDLLGTS